MQRFEPVNRAQFRRDRATPRDGDRWRLPTPSRIFMPTSYSPFRSPRLVNADFRFRSREDRSFWRYVYIYMAIIITTWDYILFIYVKSNAKKINKL